MGCSNESAGGSAAAADGPEQIGLLLLTGPQDLAIGGDEFGARGHASQRMFPANEDFKGCDLDRPQIVDRLVINFKFLSCESDRRSPAAAELALAHPCQSRRSGKLPAHLLWHGIAPCQHSSATDQGRRRRQGRPLSQY